MRLLFRPLGEWPREKTKNPEASAFTAGWADTLKLLEREIEYVIDKRRPEALIQVDAPESAMRLDGSIRIDARPRWHGVMISFESRHGPLSYACDKFDRPNWQHNSMPAWQHNVRAIALGLQDLRRLDRYGISNSGEQYRGWQALPPGRPMPAAMTVEQAARLLYDAAIPESYEMVGGAEAMIGDQRYLTLAWRTASKRHHPDIGGDPASFAQLTEAKRLLDTTILETSLGRS